MLASTELKADPGIPNLHPLKEQLLDQYSRRKEASHAEQLARSKVISISWILFLNFVWLLLFDDVVILFVIITLLETHLFVFLAIAQAQGS